MSATDQPLHPFAALLLAALLLGFMIWLVNDFAHAAWVGIAAALFLLGVRFMRFLRGL